MRDRMSGGVRAGESDLPWLLDSEFKEVRGQILERIKQNCNRIIAVFERRRVAASWSVGDLAHESTAAGLLPLHRDWDAGRLRYFFKRSSSRPRSVRRRVSGLRP